MNKNELGTSQVNKRDLLTNSIDPSVYEDEKSRYNTYSSKIVFRHQLLPHESSLYLNLEGNEEIRFSKEDLSSEESIYRPSLIKELSNVQYESPFIQIFFDKDARDKRHAERELKGNQLLAKDKVSSLTNQLSRPL